MRFDRLWDRALYEPGVGFYETGGAAGRRADFLTSVELGPLFGACLAGRLDQAWDAAGCPEAWTLVDAGAGPGTLLRAVLTAQPRCLGVLDAVLVERAAAQRAGHAGLVAWAADRGVQAISQAKLPERVDGMIVANELLDNLSARVIQRSEGQPQELWAASVGGSGDAPTDVELSWRPLDDTDAAALASERWWSDVPDDRPVPWAETARRWVGDATGRLNSGTLVVVDYGTQTTTELAARDGWLRTYADGAVGTDPTEALGRRDITADVPFDQLPPPARLSTQAEALRLWGIGQLVEAAQARQAQRPAGTMDLAWARDRSVLNEAPALVDPAGLGAFLVAEWDADV